METEEVENGHVTTIAEHLDPELVAHPPKEKKKKDKKKKKTEKSQAHRNSAAHDLLTRIRTGKQV